MLQEFEEERSERIACRRQGYRMTSFFFHFTASIKSQAFLQKWNYSVGTQNISQLNERNRTGYKWNNYLNCSRDLSVEGEAIVSKVVLVTEAVSFIEWNVIRPKLENNTTFVIEDTYVQYRPIHLRRHLAPFTYIADDASIVQFVVSGWKVDCSDGDLKKPMAVLNDRSWDFLSVAKADLVKTLQHGIPGKSLKSNILKEARALCLCKCDQCFDKEYDGTVHGYPSILDHWFDNVSYTPMDCQQAYNSHRTTSHQSCHRTSLLP